MTQDPATPDRRSTRLRTAVVGLVALLSLALTGCGDPDGGGGDGGGYLSKQVQG